MCEYFYIGFIDFMLNGKSLLEYTNLFSPSDYGKNDKIILRFTQFYSILLNSVISHDEFVLINNVLKEYNEMKEGIKNLKTDPPDM